MIFHPRISIHPNIFSPLYTNPLLSYSTLVIDHPYYSIGNEIPPATYPKKNYDIPPGTVSPPWNGIAPYVFTPG